MENKKKYVEINLGRIDPREFSEKINVDKDIQFVNWGAKNLMPNVLLDMLYNSSTHLHIVNKRKQMLGGDGVVVKKSTNKSKIETEQFIKNVNRFGDNMDNLLEKIFYDFVVFGQAAVQVIWGKGFNKISELHHIPMNFLRYNKKSKNAQIEKVWYSEDWKKFRNEEYCPIPMTPFTTIPELIVQAPTQVLLLRPYSPGCGYYTHPSYVGGLNYINLDWQISELSTATIKNGIFPSIIITQKNVSDDDKDFIVNEFEKQYTSQSNASKVIYSFVENMDDISFDTLDIKGQETMIQTLNDLATMNILQAHGMPGILVGISEAGKLGESNEINNAFIQYENTFIKPDQDYVLSKINMLLGINGLDELEITSSTPIPFQGSEQLMTKCLTINELREELGFEQLDASEHGNIVDNVVGASAPAAPATPQQIAQAVVKKIKK